MITPKLLHDYLKSDEKYSELFDEMVKKDTDWWEEELTNIAIYPTEENLMDIKKIMESNKQYAEQELGKFSNYYYYALLNCGKTKKEASKIVQGLQLSFTDDFVKDMFTRFFMSNAGITANGVKELFERDKASTIKKWKNEAETKNQRILNAIPFGNIKCKSCKSLMVYQWSMLMDSTKEMPERVLFFYNCLSQCGKDAIFEDGTPWISEMSNNCAICSGKRNSTITKDNTGGIYIIYECKKCGSKEVEKQEG